MKRTPTRLKDVEPIWRPPPDIKKIPEAVDAAQPGRITTFSNSNSSTIADGGAP